MSRTYRKPTHWERREGKKRVYDRECYPSNAFMHMFVDSHGNTAICKHGEDWTGSSHIYRRYTNRQQRAANKIIIRLALEEQILNQELDYYDSLDWYDDEEMDLPDWWYDPLDSWDEDYESISTVEDDLDDYYDEGYYDEPYWDGMY